MKIICVGWNYKAHNQEMARVELPKKPVIFLKPDSALLKDNKPFFIPDFSKQMEYECELVYKIDRIGKHIDKKFAHRYYSQVALGVDITARDLQRVCKEEGNPWEISKAFDSSAVLSNFISIDEFGGNPITFHLLKNDVIKQKASSKDMIFSIDEIIAYVSQFMTLKIGDLIYTGTPAGVGSINIGDNLKGFIESREMFNFQIK